MYRCSHFIFLILLSVLAVSHGTYYGKLIGEFTRRGITENEHHNVAGTVYAVDDNTLQIIGFTFDGMAPDTYFWIGTSVSPDDSGYIIPKALGVGNEKLGEYAGVDLVIHLDPNNTPTNIQGYNWISIWCKQAGADFADVFIPSDFTPPGEYSLGRLGLSPVVHSVTADDVIVVDSKQIRFKGLNYDGRGPDAYFWLDTRSPPTSSGTRVPKVGESSASKLNSRLTDVTVTVQLPGTFDVFNIRNIGLWCVAARQNFGHVDIPQDLETNQDIIPYLVAEDSQDFDNCEVLQDDEFQVSWTIDNDEIVVRLSSRQSPGDYMSFGLSGSDTQTDMVGSDVAVAWMDEETSVATVDDYYLSARSQCVTNTGQGVCPDIQSTDGTDNVTLSGSYREDGITHITYRRPLVATDLLLDRTIITTGPQYISWALGPINLDNLATYHSARTEGNLQIDFGRSGSTCPALTASTGSGEVKPFEVPSIKAMEDTTFRCDIGQSGGLQGYETITGNVGWGIAWYINGDLIPEITVKRNQTYTFEVYGGLNPNQSASYHPFYLTTDPAGGYSQLSSGAQAGQNIVAEPVTGSYCIYDETVDSPNPDDVDTYSAYRDTLVLDCPEGNDNPGTLVWTPDSSTPDLVYYQCYTHRYLGWKIIVTDDANVSCLSVVAMVTTLFAAIFLM